MSNSILSIIFLFFLSLSSALMSSANGQNPDSARTGYLLDAAEEFWLPTKDSAKQVSFFNRIKHLTVNNKKGSMSIGLYVREGYEIFQHYLWGIGVQDGNGYFLHRALLHNDLRWNQYVRIFAEVQSSTITGRNGGPRPVQDKNELAINQLFIELSMQQAHKALQLKIRMGKQSLTYGQGTLLDIRDANVRRSFAGFKLILEHKSLKIDAFLMVPIAGREGIFDDKIDRSQKVGGLWGTMKFPNKSFTNFDFYYILINRKQTRFNQGIGKEVRSTVGMAATFKKGNWFSYCETDLQFGKFNNSEIRAWKIASSLGYQVQLQKLNPTFTIQGAVSSGDKNSSNPVLQTFNPLFPKAIYYGYIDNAGSANLVVAHPKIELQLFKGLKIATGYYQFWKQQFNDGIYAVNGSYLLPDANKNKSVGQMWDALVTYTAGNHLIFQLIGSYYKAGDYLKQQPSLSSDIRYLGIRSTLRI